MTSLDDLARTVRHLERAVRSMNRPRLANSTIEDGAIRQRDRNGVLRGQYGLQFDGTHAPLSLGGPVPPTPSTPTLAGAVGGFLLGWDGTFMDGALVPMDFQRVEMHLSIDPEFTALEAATLVATAETPRGVTYMIPAATVAGAHYARLVCRSMSGGASLASGVAGPATALGITVRDLGVSPFELMQRRLTWGSTAPVAEMVGELWLDLSDENLAVLMVWNGTAFVPEPDPELFDAALLAMAYDDTGLNGVPALVAYRGIVAKTIKADLLEALMVLTNVLIAGNPLGNHARLDQYGFTAYQDVGEPEPNLAIRLGTSDSDFLSFVDSSGTVVASIDAMGAAQFRGLSLLEWPEIGAVDYTGVGGTLDAVLDRRPRGARAWGLGSAAGPGTTTSTGWFEVQETLHPGRRYRISTSPLKMLSTVNGDRAGIQIRYTSAVGSLPASPTTASTLLSERPVSIPDANGGAGAVGKTLSSTVETRYRFLLCYSRLSGTGSITAAGGAEMLVEDIGPDLTNTAFLNVGGGGGVPPQGQTLTVPAVWTGTYLESGAEFGTTEAVQGRPLSPVSSQRKALIGFGDLSTPLAGATIQSVVLKLHAILWPRINTGGTAVLGTHTYLAKPATYITGAAEDLQREINFPDATTRYIDITAMTPVANWISGAVRGIVLGAPALTLGVYYGRFAGAADPSVALRPELVITYVV